MSKKLTHEEFMQRVMEKNEHVRNGEIEILGIYKGVTESIQCICKKHNYIYNTTPQVLQEGCGCKYCRDEAVSKAQSMTHEEFVERISKLDNKIAVIGVYTKANDPIEFQCQLGHTWTAYPHSILKGVGCPYCSNKKVWVGFNDLFTTHPHIAALLKNPEDGYKYTYGSSKEKVDFVCANCGNIISAKIAQVHTTGLSCPICSDGVSYPNKFIRQLLKQLNVDFIPEYNPAWSGLKQYDCYFETSDGKKYVVEMDGQQHYQDCRMFHTVASDVQANDTLKTLLAQQNGIEVIRIRCSPSEYYVIKNEILNSKLKDIFDLSNVNWDLCNENSQKSLVKIACDLYMSGTKNTKVIANNLGVCFQTIVRYLKRGAEAGMCDYNPVESRANRKAVCLLNDIGDTIQQFESADECVEYMNNKYDVALRVDGLQRACRLKIPYKGFNFKYNNNNTKLM